MLRTAWTTVLGTRYDWSANCRRTIDGRRGRRPGYEWVWGSSSGATDVFCLKSRACAFAQDARTGLDNGSIPRACIGAAESLSLEPANSQCMVREPLQMEAFVVDPISRMISNHARRHHQFVNRAITPHFRFSTGQQQDARIHLQASYSYPARRDELSNTRTFPEGHGIDGGL